MEKKAIGKIIAGLLVAFMLWSVFCGSVLSAEIGGLQKRGIKLGMNAVAYAGITSAEVMGAITGVVRDYNGTPVYNAIVSVSGPSSGYNYTNINGTYTIIGLEPGTYAITTSPPSGVKLLPNSTIANVTAGATTIVDFVLQQWKGVWYVDDDGGDVNFTMIEDAINCATDGDIINVYNGTYEEQVIVNKRLILKGIGHPVVDAGGIRISADILILYFPV